MGCDPKDLEKLADLLSKDKFGETEVSHVVEEPHLGNSPSIVQTRSKMGFLWPLRTQMGAFGDEFAIKVIQPLARNDIQANNFTNKAHTDFMDAIQPALGSKWRRYMGVPRQIDEQIHNAIKFVDEKGRFTGPDGSFPPEIVQSAQNLRRVYDKYGTPHSIDTDTYLNLYRDLAITRPEGIIRSPKGSPLEEEFFARLKPGELPFYNELERKGIISNPDKTASKGFVAYINAIANATIRRPFIDSIEESTVHPYFDIKSAQDSLGRKYLIANDAVGWKAWEELKHHIFGGPTPGDIIVTDQLNKLTQMFGHKAETRDIYQVSQGLTSAFYGGVLGSPLGGRPASIIRHLGKIVPTIAQFGAKYTAQGVEKAFTPGALVKLQERGFISSPMEQILQATNVAKGVGRVISGTTDAFLKVFTAADKLVRSVTAYAAESKFDDYLQRGITNRLSGTREVRQEITKLIGEGSVDKARDAFIMDNMTNLQYVFGRANRPKAFRGALSSLAGVLMSYPLNTAEMLRIFGKQFGEGVKGAVSGDMAEAQQMIPLVRLLGITSALMITGSQFLNADVRSALVTHGALPHSLAFPKMVGDTWTAGRTNIEWLTGNLFGAGNSDLHNAQRKEADRNFARDMRAFVPGGIFFFEDIPRAIDEGSLVRMLALTPKADELNRLAKERATRNREKTAGRISGITGGIGGISGY